MLGLGDQGLAAWVLRSASCPCTPPVVVSLRYTLPVALDVGTNNRQALEDPMYMGRRSPRVNASEYSAFVDGFIDALQARWREF